MATLRRLGLGQVEAGNFGRAGDDSTTVFHIRKRATIAEVNAGALPLVPSPGPGWKLRMVDIQAIAIGGNIDAVTTVDVVGTQATSAVKLAAFAQASLLRSVVLRPGIAGTTVLADGASFMPCDANTGITIENTGNNITTGTHIDFDIKFVVDAV